VARGDGGANISSAHVGLSEGMIERSRRRVACQRARRITPRPGFPDVRQ
jgi:hypothetical protein